MESTCGERDLNCDIYEADEHQPTPTAIFVLHLDKECVMISYTIAIKYNVRLSREDRKRLHLGGLLCRLLWRIHHSFLLLFLCISVEREYVMVIGLSKRIPQTIGIFLFIFIGILLRVSAKITPRCYVHRTVTSSNHIYVPGIFWDLVEGRNDYPMLNWTKVGAQGICATNYF